MSSKLQFHSCMQAVQDIGCLTVDPKDDITRQSLSWAISMPEWAEIQKLRLVFLENMAFGNVTSSAPLNYN